MAVSLVDSLSRVASPELRERVRALGGPALAELAGTAIVMAMGLSALTLDFSASSPVESWLGDPVVRRLVTGLIFAVASTLVVYSPIGRLSGGHLNPSVTIGFSYLGKLRWWGTAIYAFCQIVGAFIGAVFVLAAWGRWTQTVHVGATVPGHRGILAAFIAEGAFTFLLVTLLFHFVHRQGLMRYTPIAAGILLTAIVVVEAPLSSTSLNPARSLGPAIVSGTFRALWVYLVAPPVGALLAGFVFSRAGGTVPCAKLVHDSDTRCHFRRCAYRPPDDDVITF